MAARSFQHIAHPSAVVASSSDRHPLKHPPAFPPQLRRVGLCTLLATGVQEIRKGIATAGAGQPQKLLAYKSGRDPQASTTGGRGWTLGRSLLGDGQGMEQQPLALPLTLVHLPLGHIQRNTWWKVVETIVFSGPRCPHLDPWFDLRICSTLYPALS
jgi:hypothetical protein